MLFRKNIKYSQKINLSTWRKTAFGTWSMTGDCQVYCLQTIDVSKCLELLDEHSSLSMTHLAGAALGRMVQMNPVINRVIRLGQYYQREDISVFFQVATDKEGKDLSGYTVKDADTKTAVQIAKEMNKNVKKIKKGDDLNYKKVKETMAHVPTILMPPIIKTLGTMMYTFNLWNKVLGPPQDSFGSAMITNIGSLGFQTGFAPLVPYSRVPLVLAMGKVYKKAVVENDEVVIKPVIDFCWTSDHRLIDGVTGAKMSQDFEKLILSPQQLI